MGKVYWALEGNVADEESWRTSQLEPRQGSLNSVPPWTNLIELDLVVLGERERSEIEIRFLQQF